MILKELLRVVEEIKKDLEYTKRLEERWVKEQKRFPLIYKYIIKQRESFQEQIEKAMSINLDESGLDNYVVNRLGIKTQKLKTAQVTPPKEEAAPGPEMPRIEKPAVVKSEAKEPGPPTDEETKEAHKALEEAAAAAALKLREKSPEPSTGPIVVKKEEKKAEEAPAVKEIPKADEKPAETEKLSSKEKLRKLASEVLDEVKKSKTT